jgi:release factor glutamine methyltransferase
VSPSAAPPDLVARLRGAGCVFAEDEARLLVAEAGSSAELESMVRRRVDGLPLEQVLGWAEFRGLRVAVAPGVFVPRRRTEFLVERALALGTALGRAGCVVLDLCAGSGAVGLAVAAGLGSTSVQLHAADIDPASVDCARRNLAAVGGRVYLGDLYDPLPERLAGRVDLLVTVAPYVPSEAIATMPPEAREHEPRRALDGGTDGLDVLRRVIASAPCWLAPGGSLLTETGAGQAPVVAAALAARGLGDRVAADPESGATVVIGTRPDRS